MASSTARDRCDWIRIAPPTPGIERAEAYFRGHGYDPHRHDTYALGFTMAGVQSFRYRGVARLSVAGQLFVLHPDEVHDGRSGGDEGFRYRILHVEPRLVREALGDGRAGLPFVPGPVSDDARLARAIGPALDDLDRPLDGLERDGIVQGLADALAASDRSPAPGQPSTRPWRAVAAARDFLDAHLGADVGSADVGSADLEAVSGLPRYALARHFRKAYGLPPGRWAAMTAANLC